MLEAMRRASANDNEAEHGIGVRLTARSLSGDPALPRFPLLSAEESRYEPDTIDVSLRPSTPNEGIGGTTLR